MDSRPTLICDLDNTLYDWVGYFVPSFYAMVDASVALLGCSRDNLLDQFRFIHQSHHNSEHPFALLETPIVQEWLSTRGGNVHLLDPVFHAFNAERRRRLVAYPGVHDTLTLLAAKGVRLVAHSDSNILGVIDRLMRLQLSSYFELVYCIDKADRVHPHGRPRSRIYEQFPMGVVRLLLKEERKPNPHILERIIADNDLNRARVSYVGDSMAKDMLMAKSAHVKAVWAEYGTRVDPHLYSKLVRISHWTEEDVQREKMLNARVGDLHPDYICSQGFHEVSGFLSALWKL